MSIEGLPEKLETHLTIGQIVRIPAHLIENWGEGYAVQTVDGWKITDIHQSFGHVPRALVEKPGISKNIPVKELEKENPKP